ncbi:MAG: anaerobic ribonucleoside-triphosphate reductase activating protein [Atopobiaceae bacterium]|nr:anaerobic ribonucleoside-triphosphate reductase activating protein [Atopobiaceae bacterium]
MNYAEIKQCDIANGTGVRTTLFVSGCRHRCAGCFNAEAWDFAAGKPFTREVEDQIIASLEVPYVNGLSVLGGEPLEPENQEALAPFLERVRSREPKASIWLWSGFTWEQLMDKGCRAHTKWLVPILQSIDVLVDGPFEQDKKELGLRFRGSANQRIIDVGSSLNANSIVLWQDEDIFSSHSW